MYFPAAFVNDLCEGLSIESLTQDDDMSVMPQGAAPSIDHLLLMRVGKQFGAAKSFAIGENGEIISKGYRAGRWFDTLALPVDDIHSLHAAFARICNAEDGAGFIVAGDVAPEAGKTITRGKAYSPAITRKNGTTRRAAPRGLVDGSRHWLVLDADKVCNILGLDPRTQPLATVRFLLSLLPASLRSASVSWQWSSSTCIRGNDGLPLAFGVAPDELGAHLRFWLSRPLTESQRKSLLNRVRAFASAALIAQGGVVEAGARVVDPQVAIFNQPIYSNRPMIEGFDDPFPDAARCGLTTGATDTVDVDALLDELPALVTSKAKELTPATARKARAERAKIVPRHVREPLAIQGLGYSAPIHDMIMGRIRARAEMAPPDGKQKVGRRGLKANMLVNRARILIELPKLVEFRRANEVGWEQGVPNGMRNQFLMIASSCLSHLFPPGMLERMVRDYAAPLISGGSTAIDAGWEGSCEYAVLAKAVKDADGEAAPDYTAASGQTYKVRTHRYYYWTTTIIDILGVTEAEMIALDFRALRTSAVRGYTARRAAGVPTMRERCASSAAHIKPWVAMGLSRSAYYANKKATAPEGVPHSYQMAWGDDGWVEQMDDAGFPEVHLSPVSERPEVRDILALMCLARDATDADALDYLADGVDLGPGTAGIKEVAREARLNPDVPIHHIFSKHGEKKSVAPGNKRGMREISRHLTQIYNGCREGVAPVRVVTYLLDQLGYAAAAFNVAEPSLSLRNSLNATVAMAQAVESVGEFISRFDEICAAQDAINAASASGFSTKISSGLQTCRYSEMVGAVVGGAGLAQESGPSAPQEHPPAPIALAQATAPQPSTASSSASVTPCTLTLDDIFGPEDDASPATAIPDAWMLPSVATASRSYF